MGVVGFLVWAVFGFALGWGKGFFIGGLCWDGWDEDGNWSSIIGVLSVIIQNYEECEPQYFL